MSTDNLEPWAELQSELAQIQALICQDESADLIASDLIASLERSLQNLQTQWSILQTHPNPLLLPYLVEIHKQLKFLNADLPLLKTARQTRSTRLAKIQERLNLLQTYCQQVMNIHFR